MEGFVLGIIDFHSKETAFWLMILMYVVNHVTQILLELITLEHRYLVHLFALIFLFPVAILTTDNLWRMLRVLITILVLILAFGAFQNVNADSYGDCNVAILSFWIILIYLSVLRVAYNLWMLLQAGLFSCCYCGCMCLNHLCSFVLLFVVLFLVVFSMCFVLLFFVVCFCVF